MSNIMFYATRRDMDSLRDWINASDEVAWIVKRAEQDGQYDWVAKAEMDSLRQQAYSVWHVGSGPLNVPSGVVGVEDAVVLNPFQGWTQKLGYPGATRPWFGGNLPGPYSLTWAEDGCEMAGGLARSDLTWLADRYRSIGNPAHPAALLWWKKLQRFIQRSAVAVPWVDSLSNRKVIPKVYLFPEAEEQIRLGRPRDVNAWAPRHVV